MVGRNSLEAADSNRRPIDPLAPAGRLTWAVAGASEDRGKDIGFAIHHVGVGEPALCDQPNIFRDVGVRGARPLAINYLVKVTRVLCIGWSHPSSLPTPCRHGTPLPPCSATSTLLICDTRRVDGTVITPSPHRLRAQPDRLAGPRIRR